MKLSDLFKVSLVASAVTLAACGGDIEITPTVNDNSTNTDNSVNNSNNTSGGDNSDDFECASYESDSGTVQGVFDGRDCIYNDSFASKTIEITSNITFSEIPDNGVHLFEQALLIGEDGNTTEGFEIPANGPTLTVEPGATLAFQSGEAIIRIARGAKIQANGTEEKPITFTSANAFDRFDSAGEGARYADWGGIIINGNGITDQCTDAERDASTCNVASEGITSYFGGDDNTDSSGSIKWAKIWYAGSGPKVGGEGDDLNSLTLNAVGSGSEFEYLHIHQGFDDGIEFFGGAATIKHIVVTDTQDDSFDFDAGWQGAGQFLYVQHGTVTLNDGTVVNMGNNGFESDGVKGESSPQVGPTNPTLANITIVTTDGNSVRDDDPSQAYKFDDEFNASIYNALLVKKNAVNSSCIQVTSDGEKQADNIMFNNSVMACSSNFTDTDTFAAGPLAGQTKASWFENSGSSEILTDDVSVLAENGFATNTASADVSINANDLSGLDSSFFESVDYIGAVSDQDTSSSWYKWVETAVNAAAQD
ncbi:hypothetical protein ABMY44_00845 [Pseudoalteromonas sp. Cnat2-41]|uniref:hypothetical protein n=1 Tax=Pseudoalteromonas TaxID=53246 RepID=UPI0006B4C846|nr:MULTISPECIES: hypothetical protein [Pseudoalteromonas]MCF2860707.1 hypothetical protein [Pseudoalteromonas sp. CNAT2-18]MCG7556576.1 hypothetical protein [Pseudoalteromonas sp. CNAT2-18.1]MCG7565582.1 hypothetical protein [Pseudoalteromonas sp. CnMc7-15]MCG7569201.1 hypothetical protein [Pseudoalteromonas sp. CNC9-20]GAP73663.1 hypothetical protein W04_0174 [Pseudoalteromonas sp. SW0106-04]